MANATKFSGRVFALILGVLLLFVASGCSDVWDYDDYSADYWDPSGSYRQMEEENRRANEVAEREWAQIQMRQEGR